MTATMARLWTSGFEAAVADLNSYDGGSGGSTTPTLDTTTFRSGLRSAKVNAGASGFSAYMRTWSGLPTPSASTSYYFRAYFCFANLPAATPIQIVSFILSGSDLLVARVTGGGKLQLLAGPTPTQIGSDSAATIVADGSTWHRVELSVALNASSQPSSAELLLDGVQVAAGSVSTTNTLTNQIRFGWISIGSPSNNVLFVDDAALNDSTGAAQNTYPGDSRVVLLVPSADSAVGTGWTNDQAATTGLSASVSAAPPAGIADTTTGGGGHQIRNATSNANVNYDATMTTYTAAGVPAGATVNAVVPVTATGSPVATSAKLGTVGVVSNPAITSINLAALGTAGAFWQGNTAGTFPTGWKWSAGTVATAPSVTLGTAPVMRVTQVTASTRIAMVCFMGIYVDYTPAAAPTATKKPRVLSSRVAAFRAALR